MKHLNTTLLVITTLIALFFFGKWIYPYIPRYENKVIIDKVKVKECVDFITIDDECWNYEYAKDDYEQCDNRKYEENIFEYQLFTTSTYQYCYKTEWVRIN